MLIVCSSRIATAIVLLLCRQLLAPVLALQLMLVLQLQALLLALQVQQLQEEDLLQVLVRQGREIVFDCQYRPSCLSGCSLPVAIANALLLLLLVRPLLGPGLAQQLRLALQLQALQVLEEDLLEENLLQVQDHLQVLVRQEMEIVGDCQYRPFAELMGLFCANRGLLVELDCICSIWT